MPPRKKTADKPNFETRLQQLEALVEKMEGGDMSLSDTLDAYEQGMKLTVELNEELNCAEKRMQELSGAKAVDMADAP